MEALPEFVAVLTGFLLRIGIPILGTALVVLLLQWLDARWKQEGELETALSKLEPGSFMKSVHCWDIRGCAPERREQCAAYKNKNAPCWEAFKVKGNLQESCQNCAIRRRVKAFASSRI